MDNERIREMCLALPHVAETLNWGHHLVYWAGDRDIGGKMFAMTDLDGTGIGVLWFHCGAERFHELLDARAFVASPYLAKAHWVTVERWDALRPAARLKTSCARAHALILRKTAEADQNRAGPAGKRAGESDPQAKEKRRTAQTQQHKRGAKRK